MKVLVTGGAGFIGSHTVDALLARGDDVRIFDNLTPPIHEVGRVPDYLSRDAELIVGDVRDRVAFGHALQGVDAVIHLAAYQDYLPDFSKFFDVNAVGTALLYELIVEKQLPIQKVVIASSQAVYGEGKYRCFEHGVQYPGPRSEIQLQHKQWEISCPVCALPMTVEPTNETVVNPHNQYAMSKYAQEMIALNLGRRYEIPSVALRFSITQGTRQSYRNAYSGILRIFTMALLHGQSPLIYEDGNQLRDYVNVRDVARAILLVLDESRMSNRVLNVGGIEPTRVIDFAHRLSAVVGSPLEMSVPGTYRSGDTRHIVSDITDLRAFGWQPQVSLDETISEYVAWAQEQPAFANFYNDALRHMQQTGTLRALV